MGRRKKGNPVDGWVLLDKPAEMTSTQAVSAVRRIFDARKAGHAGTLDPLATGLLPIALGEATKTVPFAQDGMKTYLFTIRWGVSTDTLDAEGEETGFSDVRPAREAIEAVLPGFVGHIEQIPPAFSAIRVDGARAYDLARAGETVELDARRVHIARLSLLDTPSADLAVLEMHCGKGTYVRSLVRDIASALGAEGHVAALRRTEVGPFAIADAITLADLDALKSEDRQDEALEPLHAAASDLPVLDVTPDQVAYLRQGRAIVVTPRRVEALRALRCERVIGDRDCSRSVLAMDGDEPVAIGDLQAGKLSPWRVFVPAEV
jgi:tRNA pseudouridine55 synthase